MRIIGGKYSRRVLRPPKNLPVRPTTDLAKESLFNILSNKINFEGIAALDLFTGTGSIAFEFASRGCLPVVAVDASFACIRFIQRTAGDFGMENLQTVRSDVFRFIRSTPKKFGLIFADPPYALDDIDNISRLIFENALLNKGGWLVLEHPREVDLSEQAFFVDHRKYGKVNFSFFQR
ncbi:MAG: RsmD family RNA methyltransferase [Bacteroidales bacterium]|nr:RsmD family RNA methyltransferase [Bacteroidales bacterium]MCF6342935.1 RsmD family RNA methyltransferase [Bacteroidales bacterium]